MTQQITISNMTAPERVHCFSLVSAVKRDAGAPQAICTSLWPLGYGQEKGRAGGRRPGPAGNQHGPIEIRLAVDGDVGGSNAPIPCPDQRAPAACRNWHPSRAP